MAAVLGIAFNDPGGDLVTGGMGEELHIGDIAVRVEAAKQGSWSGGKSEEGAELDITGFISSLKIKPAKGEFVIVDLSVAQAGAKPVRFESSSARFVAEDGAEYSPRELDLAKELGDVTLQPGMQDDGTIVFDVPEEKSGAGTLRIVDEASGDIAEIELEIED